VGRPLAILDDRTNSPRGDRRYREWRGALTAHKLYHELRKMVIQTCWCEAFSSVLTLTAFQKQARCS
jgi:hypothetical protein